MFTTLLRVLDAIGTALAVVFGLKPDPTRVHVMVRIDDRRR
jgi:hypothetical protein